MPKPIDSRFRYMPGLDGLRAIAVLAVVAYHLNIKTVPGGLLGVTLFFVLSGYLITDILMKQLERQKKPDIRTFLIRRARRLLPAMLLMLAIVSFCLLISDVPRLVSLLGEIGSALLYLYNWHLITKEVSYFESFGPPSPFGHLWSLAVEEQFYLFWPFILAVAVRLASRRGKLATGLLAGAMLSALLMVLLYKSGSDPSRVYYGTDTRAFALLIGAALAVVWPSWKLTRTVSERSRRILDGAGVAGLLIIGFMMARVGEYDSFLYRGGMVLFALAAAAVVAVLAHPANRLARFVGIKPLKWIGVRSYGIYLYHYPVIVLTTPLLERVEFNPLRALFQIVLTAALTELSWRYLEEPIRKGGFIPYMNNFMRQVKDRSIRSKLVRAVVSFAAVILILTTVACMNNTGQPSVNSLKNVQTSGSGQLPEGGLTAIGDSVILGVASGLEKRLPGIVIDGEVGRQLSHSVDVVEGLKSSGRLGDTVIVQLGTNGIFSMKQLEALLEAIGPERQILLVNTRVPRDWQDKVNETLAKAADMADNVKLVDWYAASEGFDDIFAKDGVHFNQKGIDMYVNLLVESL
ncbi:acetyltransferase [Paenibacillus pasadenensis]|uniref:acyltransferase family protein n=1 Tax=Paenibacillus pasadenensis TaxID=217090 RepID=UPI00203BD089|nr:acyltransferase family protein [Paenibacillus pasadenensis]MCM3749633.1 acetyltransferase [Paenibacillus pasadenensis]